jgi:hypothetical protein
VPRFAPVLIALIVCLLTPYSAANRFAVRSGALTKAARIAATCSAVNLCARRSPKAWRRFFTASWVFCRDVPNDKWSGFTHDGLSQEWHTHMPDGIMAIP